MPAEIFTTPVGRFVQGDAFEAQTKDQQGNLRTVKSGPNAGQPNPQFFMAVAFDKNDPTGEFGAFYALLDRVARTDFPALFPVPGQPCVNPKFTFKVIDGDGLDTNGKPNSAKPGFAGHWVVRFASSYPPKVFHTGRYAAHEQVTDKTQLRRGYYVRVRGSAQGNGNMTNPGLYVNLDLIEIAGYGPEIVTGPDAAEAFKAPPVLPSGASATPVIGAVPGLTPPPAAPPVASPSPAAVSPVPVSAPPPYGGYMGTPGPAPAAPTPPAPPPTTTHVMLPAANGVTREAYLAAGWTDQQLVAHGYMAA